MIGAGVGQAAYRAVAMYNTGMLRLRTWWPEATPVVVLLAWRIPPHTGEPSDLFLTLPLLTIGLTVLVVGCVMFDSTSAH